MVANRWRITGAILFVVLLAAMASARAIDGILAPALPPVEARTDTMVALVGAVGVDDNTDLALFGGSDDGFVVPQDKVLVLTDFIISPQIVGAPGEYPVQIVASPGPFTTGLVVTASAADASSFQINLTTGMAFLGGSKVHVGLGSSAGAPVNISAFGYLVKR